MVNNENETRALLEKADDDVREIVISVIDLEYAKLHMSNPRGIKDEIVQLVRSVIKQ